MSFQEVLWGVSLWVCCCCWVNLELDLNLNPAGETFFLEFLSVRDEDEDEDGDVAEVKRFLEVRTICAAFGRLWHISHLKPFILTEVGFSGKRMRYTMMCHRERGDCGMMNAAWSMMMLLGMIFSGLMISCEVSAREIQGVMYASTTEQRHSNFAKEHNKLHLTEGFGEVGRSSSSISSSSDGASSDNSGSWAASGHGHHHHNQFNSKVGGSNQLTVSKTGNANFNNIQAAIDSIPVNNAQWVQITIAAGVYRWVAPCAQIAS